MQLRPLIKNVDIPRVDLIYTMAALSYRYPIETYDIFADSFLAFPFLLAGVTSVARSDSIYGIDGNRIENQKYLFESVVGKLMAFP